MSTCMASAYPTFAYTMAAFRKEAAFFLDFPVAHQE
jgi:hypothetical protein